MSDNGFCVGQMAACGDAKRSVDSVYRLAWTGCRLVEIGLFNQPAFDGFNPTDVASMKKALRHTGVSVNSIHSAFGPGTDIGSPDARDRAAAVLLQKQTVLLAADFGARYIVVHPSTYGDQPERRARIEAAADSMAEMTEFARAHGVTLALENMLGTVIGNCEDELFEIIGRADPEYCGICFDIGHANLLQRLPELARALLGRTVTTHLHDNNGKEDQHLYPGAATIDYATFGRIFRQTGCKASLIIESRKNGTDDWESVEANMLGLLGWN